MMTGARNDCKLRKSKYGSAPFMKISCLLAPCLVLFLFFIPLAKEGWAGQTQVANERTVVASEPSFDAPSFEVSAESAYLLGIIGNPNSYEIGAEFLTA